MARPSPRVRVIRVVGLLLIATASMTPSFASGLVGTPDVGAPITVPELPKSAPATGDEPVVPLPGMGGVGGLFDALSCGATGGGGLPTPGASGTPDEPDAEQDDDADDTGREGSGSSGSTTSGSTGATTSSGSRSRTSAPPRTTGELSPAGVGKPTAGDGGVLHLARPFAPSVVIAIIGLLLLASAARGNDRLAGSWRL
jgi:hypothetical protein